MKMIIGLGNPEQKYYGTPHNVGFEVIDRLFERFGISKTKCRKNGEVAEVEVNGERVLLVKPLTYMNSSGECVKKLVKKYRVDRADIVVLVDDISVRPGEVKLKATGSVGSHNGMKSIAACLSSTEFNRLRIGVGEPAEGQDLSDYVLAKTPAGIRDKVSEGISQAANLAISLLLPNKE